MRVRVRVREGKVPLGLPVLSVRAGQVSPSWVMEAR